jgi:hypothetical protein
MGTRRAARARLNAFGLNDEYVIIVRIDHAIGLELRE